MRELIAGLGLAPHPHAGRWQAARTMGAYTLVACTVGPGFDFADFEMLRDVPAGAEVLRRSAPHLTAFL